MKCAKTSALSTCRSKKSAIASCGSSSLTAQPISEGPQGTIQCDFNLPCRFDVKCMGADDLDHRPYVVHRALKGSIERFLGVLIEHYAGAFSVWLAPIQATIISVADRHSEYAHDVRRRLADAGIRCEVDDRSERMNAKIRDAQTQKVPYMLVVGDQEVAAGNVSVRLRSGERLDALRLEQLAERIRREVHEHA